MDSSLPKQSLSLTPLEDLPLGTSYRCEGPDWIVHKTTDFGKTWEAIGQLSPEGLVINTETVH